MDARRWRLWVAPSRPESGIQVTSSRALVLLARATILGSTVRPPVTYVEITRVARLPDDFDSAGTPVTGSS